MQSRVAVGDTKEAERHGNGEQQNDMGLSRYQLLSLKSQGVLTPLRTKKTPVQTEGSFGLRLK